MHSSPRRARTNSSGSHRPRADDDIIVISDEEDEHDGYPPRIPASAKGKGRADEADTTMARHERMLRMERELTVVKQEQDENELRWAREPTVGPDTERER